MRVIADTNVLVRVLTRDHAQQSKAAEAELASAEVVALSISALCELVWVLSQGYKIPASEIAASIRRLIDSANVVANRPAVEAGLAMLETGGDFADGVIAHEGRRLGADVFVSFDKKATRLIEQQGEAVRLLS